MGSKVKLKDESPLLGFWLIISAAILWGTTGTSQAFAPAESTPQAIGALRLLVGGAALVLLAFTKDRFFFRAVPLPLAATAGFFVAAYQICFFWGVSLTGVAIGTIVGIGSSPVFAGILDIVILKKKPTRRWYLSTLLALLGCTLLVGSSGDLQLNPTGILLAAGAGLSYATYALCIKLLLPGRKAESVTAVVFSIGALLLLPLLFRSELRWVMQPSGLIVIVHLGLFATALSYYLFSKGLERIQVSTAVTLSLAEPVTAGLLGVLVVGENLSPGAWYGVVSILAGLTILAIPASQKNRHILN